MVIGPQTVGMTPCLKLLGFKSRKENLKFQESVKHSYFLQPNEEAFSGSRRTFIALLESMIKKEVIGYAVLLARKSARPQICILIPQMEQLDRTGHQDRAAGLHVIQLPFADDIREIGITSTISAVVRPSEFEERWHKLHSLTFLCSCQLESKNLLESSPINLG